MQYTSTTPWRSSHRARLARLSSYDLTNQVEVIPSPPIIGLHLAHIDAHPEQGDGGRADEQEEEKWEGDRRRSRKDVDGAMKRVEKRGADLRMKDVLLGVEQGQLNERLLDIGLAYTAIRECSHPLPDLSCAR